ncbi:MAG: HAMP domain-containing sensor histidine kinase [Lachnospiraceae bacterium]|nr:ATP-binding protein [Robinsoniella sp.]MDY3766809.1 HAMP domain-containing sensor histidine kinase [Lachnospiraceae bacterium]
MRKKTLLKFLLAYLICALTGFLCVTIFCSALAEKHLIKTQAEALYSEISNLAGGRVGTSYLESEVSSEDIYTNLSALSAYQSTEFWLLNSNGDILIDTSQPYSPDSVRKIPDFDPSELESRYYQIGDFFGMFDEETLSVVSPITDDFTTRGYICSHFNMRELDDEKNGIMNICYLTLGVILFLFLLLILLFYYQFYIPLLRVTEAAGEYALGNLNYQLPIDGDDEFAFLSSSLKVLADEVNQSGEYQRKFISNISHDLRSPLTSIKGYLEAILDGTIPPEKREHYLKIVLSETERLNKLASVLLTLNTYDDKKVLLELSDFDINDIIRQTVATFEVLCQRKNLTVDLVFEEGPLNVSADRDRIQQVLYNLIDNAIKFSNSGSSIRIETTELYDKVFVSVKDNGVGIAKEDLPKIWTRFYKSDLSRGKDKKGTGLGLAITKEIIQSHGEHINVVSTLNVGTEFTFSLQRSIPDQD